MKKILPPLHPRDPKEAHRAATQLELFFDLVSVIAIAALTASFHHALSEGHGLEKLPNFLLIFVSIWWVWMNYTWFSSAFDNGDATFRIFSFLIITGELIFTAGVPYVFKTLDFSFTLLGWIIMRLGMALLWLRAALASHRVKPVALRYLFGILLAQTLWTLLYFSIEPGTSLFLALACGIFALEFLVPIVAEQAGNTPWHRHHIVERYGLLHIIVLGEVLLSISFMFRGLFEDGMGVNTIIAALSALTIVFVIWWLYFIETAHLKSSKPSDQFIWSYIHVFLFVSTSILGAGFAGYLDFLQGHSHSSATTLMWYIHLSITCYLFTLWLIRDRFEPHSITRSVLLIASLFFATTPLWNSSLAITSMLMLLTLIIRAGCDQVPSPLLASTRLK
ncbi:low temperature requirement protein A [Endozoicomonas sp. SM1973]|uniref:Low temperature requirement protein A n=1 Tax=Spartinivicinus marinus TaxID=2994442 RepID=A0A853I251_9GAMM|nr:low temperature requirement protein A [Spartinivicinus marinus]MCX4028708.1 low temperature requirement protein A [Spartinivicinus marinus]NYZ68030.1 low temperature requirement protein A [Spartinivicinus marinus]